MVYIGTCYTSIGPNLPSNTSQVWQKPNGSSFTVSLSEPTFISKILKFSGSFRFQHLPTKKVLQVYDRILQVQPFPFTSIHPVPFSPSHAGTARSPFARPPAWDAPFGKVWRGDVFWIPNSKDDRNNNLKIWRSDILIYTVYRKTWLPSRKMFKILKSESWPKKKQQRLKPLLCFKAEGIPESFGNSFESSGWEVFNDPDSDLYNYERHWKTIVFQMYHDVHSRLQHQTNSWASAFLLFWTAPETPGSTNRFVRSLCCHQKGTWNHRKSPPQTCQLGRDEFAKLHRSWYGTGTCLLA